MKANSKRILFFDGVCHLCNTTVDFALPKFKEGEILFAPLQGPTAHQMLTTQDLSLNYVVYYRDEIIYRKSKAIIYLLGDMKGFYRALSIMLRLIPNPVADFFYDLVAKYRYHLFGKYDTCRLPTAEERKFFID